MGYSDFIWFFNSLGVDTQTNTRADFPDKSNFKKPGVLRAWFKTEKAQSLSPPADAEVPFHSLLQ